MTETNQGLNAYGLIGFVLSIVAVVMSFIKVNAGFTPGYEWIVWAVWTVATLLSVIGVFRRPRGLAWAGVVICFVAVCIMYFVAETMAPL